MNDTKCISLCFKAKINKDDLYNLYKIYFDVQNNLSEVNLYLFRNGRLSVSSVVNNTEFKDYLDSICFGDLDEEKYRYLCYFSERFNVRFNEIKSITSDMSYVDFEDYFNIDESCNFFKFTSENFEKSIIKRADFSGLHFEDVSFKDANLMWTKFVDCTFNNVDFSGADLHCCDFSSSKEGEYLDFSTCIFNGANIDGAEGLETLDKSFFEEIAIDNNKNER